MGSELNKKIARISEAFEKMQSEEERRSLIFDLMSAKEIEAMAQRIEVVELLSENTVYSKIVEQTGASTTTISRVNHAFQYGEGGYKILLERLKNSK